MTVYLLVHYGYTEDYEVLRIFRDRSKAFEERDRIRNEKRNEGMPEYHVTDFEVLCFHAE